MITPMCLPVAGLGLLLLSGGTVPARGEETVHFADPALKAAVEEALWVTDPTVADMLGLTELSHVPEESLQEGRISDLTGLEYAVNLQRLDLRLNRISDLKLLSGLTYLQTLDLSCNQIRDLQPLSGLNRLRSVDLHQNQICDLSPLSGLGSVERLILRFNQISDLTPLSNLTRLRHVDLHANSVSDISPLGGLTNLRCVDLRSNPLSPESYEVHLPCIAANNPAVCITCDPSTGPETLYVDDDAAADCGPADPALSDPDEDGTAEHPFDRIQEAIDAVCAGGLILVQPGTYRESIDCLGKSVRLTGVPSNSGTGPLFPVIEGVRAGPVVTFGSRDDQACLLSGFAITAGCGQTAGAILCDRTTITLTNCLIVGNRTTEPAGAAIHAMDSNLVVANCTIADNGGGPGAAGVALAGSRLTIANSILWNDAATEILSIGAGEPDVRYCAIRGSWPGAGCTEADPQFVRSGLWIDREGFDPGDIREQWIAGDYHLRSRAGRWDSDAGIWTCDETTSPCIDGGDPTSEVAGEPLPNGGIINVGAYGGTRQASKSAANPEADE